MTSLSVRSQQRNCAHNFALVTLCLLDASRDMYTLCIFFQLTSHLPSWFTRAICEWHNLHNQVRTCKLHTFRVITLTTHKVCLKETPTTSLLSPWKSVTKRKTGMQWTWGGASAAYKNRCGLAVMMPSFTCRSPANVPSWNWHLWQVVLVAIFRHYFTYHWQWHQFHSALQVSLACTTIRYTSLKHRGCGIKGTESETKLITTSCFTDPLYIYIYIYIYI